MSCFSPSELLAFSRGELSGERFELLRAHLPECAACRANVEEGLDRTVEERPPSSSRKRGSSNEPVSLGAEAAAAKALEEGKKVGRYLVLRKLGEGGMGSVYAAYDPELDRKVALKQLRVAEDGSRADAAHKRFAREAQAMARLAHPNVAAVYDVVSAEGSTYIAMELIDGPTLGGWLEERPRSQKEVLEKFLQAGRGLAAAHAAGLVHRDFKPDNVLIAATGRVCVVDFGLARAQTELTPLPGPDVGPSAPSVLNEQLTAVGLVVGTPSYMAPEQWRGRASDARTDQFSYCVALYRALYGEHPFGQSSAEIKQGVLAGALRSPPKGAPVPPWLLSVLHRGLAKEPAERFSSMEALLRALENDPSKRRRRLGLWASAAAALMLLGLSVVRYGGRHQRACALRQARMNEVFGPTRTRALEQALTFPGTPEAQELATRVMLALTSFQNEWLESHGEACAEQKRAGVLSPVDTPPTRCLEERVEQLDRLGRLLSEGGPQRASSALGAVYSLLPPRLCLAEKAAEPKGLRSSLRRELVDARALSWVGRLDEARALAGSVIDRAQQAKDRVALSEGKLFLGRVLLQAEQFSAAEEALFEAVDLAQASGHDRVAALAWTELTLSTALGRGQYELALRHARHARAMLERYGGLEECSATLADYVGFVYQLQGSLELALEWQRRSVTLYEKLFGPEHPAVAGALVSLGNTVRELGNAEEALQLQQRALAIISRSFPKGHVERATALNGKGRSLLALGRAKEAEAAHEEALAILTGAGGDGTLEVAKTLATLAESKLKLGEDAKAAALLERALETPSSQLPVEHPVRMALLLLAADVEAKLGRSQKARRLVEEALAHASGSQASQLRAQATRWLAEHPQKPTKRRRR